MSTQSEWWETFFTELTLDIQRRIDIEKTRAQADAIVKLLHLPPQANVLDVPCGNGRHSIEMASRGHRLTGVDTTLPLLEDARNMASERQLDVTWEHRDMRDLPWQEEFDGTFCFGGSFGYFDDEGNRSFLMAVSRALKPGARFLVDTHNVETILPRFRERFWRQYGSIFSLQEARYDHVHGRLEGALTLIREGTVVKKTSSIRMYTYRELCQLLEEAGFANCEGYGSLDQEPFKLGSPRLYMVATKR